MKNSTIKLALTALLFASKTTMLIAQGAEIIAPTDSLKTKGFISRSSVEIGFNANAFVKQFLSFNTFMASNQQPYLLTAKWIFSNRYALRTGLGFNSSNSQSEDLSTNSSSTTIQSPVKSSQKSNSLNYRLGFEIQKSITKNFRVYAALDGIYNSSNTSSESNNSQTTNTFINGFMLPVEVTTKNTSKSSSQNYGAAAVVGLQYNINKRISFFTESNFSYLTGTDKSSTESTSISSPTVITFDNSRTNSVKGKSNSTQFNLPVTLFVSIKL